MVGAVVATREEQALRRGGRSMRFARESDRHQRPRRQRRLGERRNGASRARSASGRLVRTLSAPTATASPSRDHKNESMQAFRFKTVVGPGSHDRRFLGHACSTLPALYRTHGPSQEHGALLCALDRTDLVRHFCLTRRWGRIGSSGQSIEHHFDGEKEAVAMFLNLLCRKRARGYSLKTIRHQRIG